MSVCLLKHALASRTVLKLVAIHSEWPSAEYPAGVNKLLTAKWS